MCEALNPRNGRIRNRCRKQWRPVGGGKTGRLHVRSVWGKPDPQGRQARLKKRLLLSSLLAQLNGVAASENKSAIPACRERQKRMLRLGTHGNSLMPHGQ